MHWDKDQGLLYLSSSDRSSMHDNLAKAVGATALISGDRIFRVLGKINRLVFQNVGVRKHGRRNLSFAMYTGADVAEALSLSEREGSVKSNLSGMGWEGGKPITIGCSYKGRIWSREVGTIPEFVGWCRSVGVKLLDGSIETAQIIANVLIPEEVTSLPDKQILGIDWPHELLRQSEERVILRRQDKELPIYMFNLEFVGSDIVASSIAFRVIDADGSVWADYSMTVGGTDGFQFQRTSGVAIELSSGSLKNSLEGWLSSYPPLVRFVDLSELDGNLLIRPQHTEQLVFPQERFEVWDWTGVDVTKESIWKEGQNRKDSIQWRAASHFLDGGFDVIFDDDSAGEAADLVCFKEEADHIRLAPDSLQVYARNRWRPGEGRSARSARRLSARQNGNGNSATFAATSLPERSVWPAPAGPRVFSGVMHRLLTVSSRSAGSRKFALKLSWSSRAFHGMAITPIKRRSLLPHTAI